VEDEQQSPPPVYRDAFDYATIAMVALAAAALLNAGLFVWGAAHFENGNLPVTPKPLRDLQYLVRFITAAAFIAWLNRVYANVEALYGTTAFERWWAIGGFVVPPFLFFRPCELVAEAWRRSSKDDDPPILVYAWWTAYVIAPGFSLAGRKPMAQLLGIIASALAMMVVLRVTQRQRTARNTIAAATRAAAVAEKRARMAAVVPKAAPAPVAPAPAPAASTQVAATPQIAPQLAAMDAENARRAAERRAAFAATRMPTVETPRPIAISPKFTAPSPAAPPLPRSHDDVWARILSVALALGALTMLAVAVAIVFHPGSEVVAGVYGSFAFLLLVLAFVVGRHQVERNSLPDGWVKIALFGMAVGAASIIVSIGAAVR
jgi:Domain of unknown function (DUF4328)